MTTPWLAYGQYEAAKRFLCVEANLVGLVQGAFYLVTGTWPLLHMRSFLAVTGPKTDLWLVKTVAGLIVAIGASLLASSLQTPTIGQLLLGLMSALALGTVDVYYSAKGVIRKIYLLDSLIEVVFIGGWTIMFFRGSI